MFIGEVGWFVEFLVRSCPAGQAVLNGQATHRDLGQGLQQLKLRHEQQQAAVALRV